MPITKITKLLLFLILANIASSQTHVYVSLDEANASPATNRIISVQRLQPFVGDAIDYSSSTNGYFYISNIAVGDYSTTIKPRASSPQIKFLFTVTSTNLGVTNATGLISVSGAQTYPATGKSAWSIAASDARYAAVGSAVTQAGLAAGSYPINAITNSGTNFSVSFNYPPIAASGYPSWFFLTNKLLKFAGGTNTTDAFQFQWGPTANNYIDFGAASPGVNSAYSFLMRGYNAMGFECPSDFGTIRLGDDHRLDAQVKLSIQQVGEGLWYATNNFSGMLQFESRQEAGYVGKAAIRAKNATGVEVYNLNGQPYSQSELWLYTLAPPQLANSAGGFRSVGDTNWFLIGVTNSAVVKGLTVSSNALSLWPAAPRNHGDAMVVNSNGYPYLLLSTNGTAGSATWTGTNKLGW